MNPKNQPDQPAKSQFLVYAAEDGRVKIEVRLEGETVWLTQQHMADLFQTTQQNVSLHLQNIYAEGELRREATHKEFLSVRQEGPREVSRALDFYNLDAIISVGYRVKSAVATRFRIWATQRLREFIVKGFVLDDERLKNPDRPFDYFEELLRRIQDIRTSERRFDQKVFGPGGTLGGESAGEVVLLRHLVPALKKLNPKAPPEAIDAAVNELTRDRSVMSLAAANREVHALLKNGVHRVHRHAADSGRGKRRSSAITSVLTISSSRWTTAQRSRCSTKTASLSCN
ncbi:MAG TPA: RhuM family protein [Candidatus Paceibacterota bacterium]|nr:RhuM family protein [Verrucomicrobiota bacterium]HRZ46978.1 RhuM family protein [Candidatus Paceibacterota bacterium]HRZ93158.1 RhuM family protein [Candidatus Paceibacterota bacterium]